jgi:hypothetical protein
VNKNRPANHGEGDPQAAERFNIAERAFVDSARGKKKIKEGPQVTVAEEAELAKAEQIGRSHAKDDDSKSA